MIIVSDKGDRLVDHFTLSEMANNQDGGKLIITQDVIKFAQMMDDLRKWFNAPITVNSWYRTASFNAKVGGATNSMHLQALACDFTRPSNPPKDWTVQQWQNVMIQWSKLCNKYGIKGGSIEIAPTWCHVDVRPREKFTVMNHKDKQVKSVWVPKAYLSDWHYIFI